MSTGLIITNFKQSIYNTDILNELVQQEQDYTVKNQYGCRDPVGVNWKGNGFQFQFQLNRIGYDQKNSCKYRNLNWM